MDSNIISALIGVVGALIGTWIGGIISRKASIEAVESSNKNAIFIMQQQEKNMAIADFRAHFATALAHLYLTKKHGSRHEKPEIDEILKGLIPNQSIAIEKFRPFVTPSSGTAYQEAWEKYRYEAWNYGFDANSLRQDISDPYMIYEKLIQNILQFAK